ncbi:hypothetical protein MGN70_005543 [Eutypa lata]|nr:hypothetical protein MGN70_005543 [Eutypa lata]
MEKTEVIIVGAGPSGLALGLSLAKFGIKSILLEKETGITHDPRGVYLTNEAVRILWDLGIGSDLKKIGHDVETINFHNTSFQNAAYYIMDPRSDFAQQTVQNGIFQIQPELEASLRRKLDESKLCDLRSGCEVIQRDQSSGSVVVTYKTEDGSTKSINGSWLVGADGKRGVVRKHFLEKSGIQQVEGAYRYERTWIASNLKIDLPTPETHPAFPLWELGLTPEEVYDLYWPRGFHFCAPPGKPTASGRFGPHEGRLWRHEFAQHDYNETMNCEDLLWEHIAPMITRSSGKESQAFPSGPVAYPRDCITIMRCRPFRFTHKMVNRWFEGRTILIGDAAHVFPPFGGQGIACGVADSHQLAWRLFLLLRLSAVDEDLSNKLLTTWASERKRGVTDAAEVTKFNGQLCNVGDSFGFWFFRTLAWLSRIIPFVPTIPHPFTVAEKRGFGQVPDSFFLSKFNGGGRVAQICVQSGRHSPMLSDGLLRLSPPTVLTLLVIDSDAESIQKHVYEAGVALNSSGVQGQVVSRDSIRVFSPSGPVDAGGIDVFFPTTLESIADLPVRTGYKSSTYAERFAPTTKYALIRNDFYIFAQARGSKELNACLAELCRQTLQLS